MFKIYTDGSSKGNPGLGGWAIVIFADNQYITHRAGYELNVTNNRMELTAILTALKYAKNIIRSLDENEEIIIYSDSAYCVNAINIWIHNWVNNNWTRDKGKEIKNLDLFKDIYNLYYDGADNISIKKVSGHSGILGNELADALCCNNKKKIKTTLITLGAEEDLENSSEKLN